MTFHHYKIFYEMNAARIASAYLGYSQILLL